jgi:hypothetical protein
VDGQPNIFNSDVIANGKVCLAGVLGETDLAASGFN